MSKFWESMIEREIEFDYVVCSRVADLAPVEDHAEEIQEWVRAVRARSEFTVCCKCKEQVIVDTKSPKAPRICVQCATEEMGE